jgi:hypothetical protein
MRMAGSQANSCAAHAVRGCRGREGPCRSCATHMDVARCAATCRAATGCGHVARAPCYHAGGPRHARYTATQAAAPCLACGGLASMLAVHVQEGESLYCSGDQQPYVPAILEMTMHIMAKTTRHISFVSASARRIRYGTTSTRRPVTGAGGSGGGPCPMWLACCCWAPGNAKDDVWLAALRAPSGAGSAMAAARAGCIRRPLRMRTA